MSGRDLPVGRLLAEFGVIVIGVLVALFAESAWQERGERIEEREVLERIHLEVVEDSGRISGTGLWLDFVTPAARRVPMILEGRDTLPASGALALIYAASTINTPGALIWSWDELRQNGRTDLIRDDELRRGLSGYYGLSDEFEEGREALPASYRATVLGLLPTDYMRRILNECLRDENGRPLVDAIGALESCPVVPADADGDSLLRRLSSTAGLVPEATRLAYELELMRERYGTLAAYRDTLLIEMGARGIGGN